jgi:hypothetical protein
MRRVWHWLSLVNFVCFLVLWAGEVVRETHHERLSVAFTAGYWLSATVGLILGIYGFVSLLRSGKNGMTYNVLTVLFALIPGCTALVHILSFIGSNPV